MINQTHPSANIPVHRHSFLTSPLPLIRRARSTQLAEPLLSSSTTRPRAINTASRPLSTRSPPKMEPNDVSILSIQQILTNNIVSSRSQVRSIPPAATMSTSSQDSTTASSASIYSRVSAASSLSGSPAHWHPSTSFATLTTWPPPTLSQLVPERHGSSILFTPLSIALMSSGGAIILLTIFIAFRRLRAASRERLEAEVINRDSSIFGDFKTKREHEWVEVKDSAASSVWSQSQIRNGTNAEMGYGVPQSMGKPRLPNYKSHGLDLSSNAWGVRKDDERMKHDTEQIAGLAGVGIWGRRNDNTTKSADNQVPPETYPVDTTARSLIAKDQIGINIRSSESLPQGDVEEKTSSVWSASSESSCKAEISTASRSKIISTALSALNFSPRSINSSADPRPEITIPTCKPVQPLTLRRSATINQQLGNLSDFRGEYSASCSNLPHHLHFGDQPGLMREDAPPYSLSKSRSVADQSGVATDASCSKPSYPARSRYTPSSGRFQVPVPVYDSQHDSVQVGTSALSFPLPPPINTSLIAASTSLPYVHSKTKSDDRKGRTSVRLSYASAAPDSPTRGLESLGGMMMNDYYVSDGGDTSGAEDLPILTSAKRVSRSKHQMAVVESRSFNRRSRTLGFSQNRTKPSQPVTLTRKVMSSAVSVPQITVTATPSTEDLKRLNHRLSRGKHSMKTSASTPSGASFPPGRPLFAPSTSTPHVAAGAVAEVSSKGGSSPDDEWLSLSQMAMKRVHPQYRSATYSIYGMYNGTEGDSTDRRVASSSVGHPTLGRTRSGSKSGRTGLAQATRQDNTTLSTIYSGYGLSRNEEDISASFVREVGDSLGRIGRI